MHSWWRLRERGTVGLKKPCFLAGFSMGLDRIASEETNDSKAGFYFIHTNLRQTRMYGQEINKSQKKKKIKEGKKIINELD